MLGHPFEPPFGQRIQPSWSCRRTGAATEAMSFCFVAGRHQASTMFAVVFVSVVVVVVAAPTPQRRNAVSLHASAGETARFNCKARARPDRSALAWRVRRRACQASGMSRRA
ncbi:hypothetical protein JDV02_008971 [Purpureocillium takamizusanense]|uniref:Uncharacterized protein n=1 Tax=Purpureocillium takamizusanense TaxID=2060973 RepID=A0A9Q8VFP8_9HYPO|nr:uncharacterized protein JDV02_008971 [Purpureocillium takamizusanense]UNI23134.1 hypothetical protein JDV02_008971 [Purpureocillium takamizusanense]